MNTTSFNIIELKDKPEWLPQIAQWHHLEWLATHPGFSQEEAEKRLEERKRSLQKHLNADAMPTTFIAHQDDKPLGTVSLVYYQFSEAQKASEWLTNLYVDESERGQGIATALLRCAIKFAQAQKLPRLLLYTRNHVNFYRKRSWRSINRGIVQGEQVEIMDYLLS